MPESVLSHPGKPSRHTWLRWLSVWSRRGGLSVARWTGEYGARMATWRRTRRPWAGWRRAGWGGR
jgi:hypothetical protein